MHREFQINPMMPRFRGQQRAIDLSKLLVGQTVRQNLETLTTPRFDERRNQQDVDQSIGFVPANERVQCHAVGTRAKRVVSNSACIEQCEDLLEVIEFVPGQLRQRFLKEAMMRVRKKQFDGCARRLFLAMRVIEQNLIKMISHTRQPFARRHFRQMQHGGRV